MIRILGLQEVEVPAPVFDGVQFHVVDSGPGFVVFELSPTLGGKVVEDDALLFVWTLTQREGELMTQWPEGCVIADNGAQVGDAINAAWLLYDGNPLRVSVYHSSQTVSYWAEVFAGLPSGGVRRFGSWNVAPASPPDPQ